MLDALARFLGNPRPSPNPPGGLSAPRTPLKLGDYSAGFWVSRGPERVAEVVLGSSEEVAEHLSEQGWYEISDMLYAQRGRRAYVSYVHADDEGEFAEILAAVKEEAKRRGAVGLYAHADVADMSDDERDARVAMWTRAGFDLLGEDRQQEPIMFRRL